MLRILLVPLILLLASLLPALPCRAAGGPQAQLQSTIEAVLTTLKDESVPIEIRRERLAEQVQDRFDLPTIARWVLGPYWRTAGEAERQRFIELFPELVKATYLGRIKGYRNERVDFLGEEIDGDHARVETRVTTARTEVPVDYKLVRRGENWLVYDVIVENISMVRNYRSTYTEIVRQQGMEGLLERMGKKIAELRANQELAPTADP